MAEQVLEPPRDQYGNAILPGYRKPFQKGEDPRRFKGNVRYKMITLADASRVLSKVEALVDEMRKLRPKRKRKSPMESLPFSPTISPRSPKKSSPQVKPEPTASPSDSDCPF